MAQHVQPTNNGLETFEYQWYHTHMAMALVRMINSIPQAAARMQNNTVPRVYTAYTCLQEMARTQRALANGLAPNAGPVIGLMHQLNALWMRAHRIFMFYFADQPLTSIQNFVLDGALPQYFPANEITGWEGAWRGYVIKDQCENLETLLRYCCTNKLWEAHKGVIRSDSLLLQVVFERLLKWPLPDRMPMPAKFFKSYDGLNLVEPTALWEYESALEVLPELIKAVRDMFQPNPLEDIQARLGSVREPKDVPYEIALEIHQVWRQMNIALEIANKFEAYKRRTNVFYEQIGENLLPDIPAVAWLERLLEICNKYTFYQWYDVTMNMVSIGGSGIETADVGGMGVGDVDYGMVQVARQAFLNNETVKFMTAPKDM